MLTTKPRIKGHQMWYCQKCTKRNRTKPVSVLHEPSGSYIKICKYCRQLYKQNNQPKPDD